MTLRTMKTFFTVAVLSVSLSAFASTNATSANHATSSHNATVVSGHATLSSVAATTTVTQSSQTAIINWRDFSTRAGDAIHIHQPNALATAIIRVQGDNASRFDGRLTANGQVMIVNANGMVAGETAQFNTAGLVLSTGMLSERDATHSTYRFHNATAPIDFHGTIDGGYVAMIAQQITNHGSINAHGERVELTAADSVTLNFNHGDFAGVQVDKGALDAVADNAGSIQSDGGVVHVTATAASNTANATVNHSGVIAANSTATATGEIMLISDMGVGKTTVSGELYAKADGHLASNGGFIDTSGAKVNIADTAAISTKATHGKTGTWLIDPQDYTIAASGGDITGAALSNLLSKNNVIIESVKGATAGNGDIHVNDTVNWSENKLTLTAHRNININSSLNATSSEAEKAELFLKYGQSSVNGGNSDYYVNAPVNLPAGLANEYIFLTQKGSDGDIYTYTVITQLDDGNQHADTSTKTLQGMKNNLSGYYVLGADIDARSTRDWDSKKGFAPVGDNSTNNNRSRFGGTFDGLGHTITGLKIDRQSQDYVGLFGITESSSQLRNIGMVGGSIKGHNDVGGLVGFNSSASISNSYATGSVSGGENVGGLVGQNDFDSSISNSYATGSVSGTDDQVGGLVGFSYGSISNSYATGSIKGHNDVGGLVGTNSSGSISNSYATGSVSGSVSGGDNVGGLVGVSYGRINNSYATGSVSGSSKVGGLVGSKQYGGISNSYATGRVSEIGDLAGGLVGFRKSGSISISISNSYWDKDTTANGCNDLPTCEGAKGLTTADMKKASSFTGWDIDSTGGLNKTWRMYMGKTAPLLKVFMKKANIKADQTVTYNGSSQTVSDYTLTDDNGIALDKTKVSDDAAAYTGTGKNADTYTTTVKGLYSDQQGYDLVFNEGQFTVNKANLILTGSRTYDGTTKTAGDTLTATGVNGETFSVKGAGDTSNLSSKNVSDTEKALASVTGLTLGTSSNGGLATNYNALSTSGSQYIIEATVLAIAAKKDTRTYDGTTSSNKTPTFSGLMGSDSLTGLSQRFDSKNAGARTLSVGNGYTLNDGNSGNNYLVYTQPASGDINKANLTLTGSRTYDGTTKTAGDTLTATGVNGESFSVTGAGDSSNLSSKNASATAQTLASVTGLALGTSSNGGLASNYNALSTAGSQYTINLGQFTLSYHANGGKTAPASVKVTAGSSTTLAAGISRDGYTFAGWNSKADGTGTNYAAGISFTMPNADTALYAKWKKNKVLSKVFATPNGTGKLTISGGGQTCELKSVTYYQKAQDLSGSPQAPDGLAFKQGLVGFVAESCDKGSTITIAIEYPNTIASGAKLTKWGKTASNKTNHWYDHTATISGNTVTYTVTDGGNGDDDLTDNGTIVDPAGVSSRANAPSTTRPVPSLGTVALLLMALLLALVAGFGRRYRRI